MSLSCGTALEHPPDEPRTRDLAVFHEADGEPRARFNPFMIVHGHRLAERPLDALGQQALDTVWDILGEHDMHTDFELEAGQIQYLANYHVAHRRTTYEDFDDDEERPSRFRRAEQMRLLRDDVHVIARMVRKVGRDIVSRHWPAPDEVDTS